MLRSWDIKINGRPYVFGAVPGVQLGGAVAEPATPAEVASIVIASLHGGIGRGFENGILRYRQAQDLDLTIPGEIVPGYVSQTVGSFSATGLVASRPAFGYGDGGATVFIVAGQTVQSFAPGNPGGGLQPVTVTGSFPTASEFSGAVFQYNQELVFGVIANSAGNVGKPAAYGKLALASPGTVSLLTSDAISYGASTRARAFWVEDDTGLRWAPFVASASFKGGSPYVEYPSSGPGIELGFPRTSWLTMVGPSLLVLRQDGVVIGANEQGLLSIAGNTPLNGLDTHFGRRSAPYHDGVLIPGRTGLWSFDMRSLTMRPASPNYIQGQSERRLRGEVTAVGAAGPYGFVALRQVSAGGVVTGVLLQIVRYQDRIAVHDLGPTTAANEIITDVLPYYDSNTRRTLVYYLVFNEATATVELRYKPMVLPADQHTAGTGLATSAWVDLPSVAGPQPAATMTKLWTQVRGYFDKGSSPNAQLQFSNFAIDGAPVTLATVTQTGPFAVPFGGAGNRLGRELTAGRLTLVDPAPDTRVDLPLTIDFVWVPDTQDAVQLKLLVSGEVAGRVAALWRQAPWDTTQELLALRGTIVTVDFPEGTSWTALCEAVTIDDVGTPDGAGQTARVATLHIRRIS